MYLGRHQAHDKGESRILISERKGLVKAAFITMEFGLAIQIMIVVVYWSLIHEGVMKEVHDNNEGLVVYWIMIFIHFVPFLTILSNVLLTRVVFLYEHYKYCLYLGLVYGFTNFVGTKVRGKPLYAFLTWEDYTSVIIAAGLTVVAMTFFLTMSFFVNLTKRCPHDVEQSVFLAGAA